jgi:hypothetical protein
MSEFKFKHITFSWPEKWSTEAFLWVWNPDKIPPHIGFSLEKNYFSLTYREVEQKQTLSQLRKAKRSQIPLLLIRIPTDNLKFLPESVFLRYDRAKVGGATCLSPLKDLLEAPSHVHQLAHLLHFLEDKNGKLAVFGLHLDESYEQLPIYSINQIMHRIEELNDIKR